MRSIDDVMSRIHSWWIALALAVAVIAVIALPHVDAVDLPIGICAAAAMVVAAWRLRLRPFDAPVRWPWLYLFAALLLVVLAKLIAFFGDPSGAKLSRYGDAFLWLVWPGALLAILTDRSRPLSSVGCFAMGALALALPQLGIAAIAGLDDALRLLSVGLALSGLFLLVARISRDRALRLEKDPVASGVDPYLDRVSIRDGVYPPAFVIGLGLPRADTPAGQVHRICNRALWPAGDVATWFMNVVRILLWPILAVPRSLAMLKKMGRVIESQTGKSRLRQFAEQWYLAVRHRVPPRYYYSCEFFRPEVWRLAPHYLMRYETKEIAYRLLYPRDRPGYAPASLKNKMEFAQHCHAHDVRAVPVLMTFEDGKALPGIGADRAPECLPAVDLFIKPILGKGGSGAERWRHLGAGRYRNTHGSELSAGALMARAAELSVVEPFIIQPALVNHSAIVDLGAGALCTVRMMTCRSETGGFEATNAAFRMSVDPASAVDNFHAGGVAAAVDMQTGRLGAATDIGGSPKSRWHQRHPFSNAQIGGRILPHWRETVALAERAHAAFGDYTIIGWDIAILEDGPCIVEGNRGPDVDIIQRTALAPIGTGRFGELLAYNLIRGRREARRQSHLDRQPKA